MTRIWSWLALVAGLTYFFLPLIGTVEFSLRMRRAAEWLPNGRSALSSAPVVVE